MAQQTQMSRVLPAYERFIAAFPTVVSLARASTARVLRAWAGMGYNMRALRLHRAAKRVVRDGRFPRSASQLEGIEGVGPCTAAVISSFAFGEAVTAVDTNVERIVGRLWGGGAPNARLSRERAATLVSRRAPARWNQAMMDLGALVCTARAPKCAACPIARWCRSRTAITRSTLAPKAATTHRQPYAGSRRYYRGRIVQALRELPRGASMSHGELLRSIPERNGLDRSGIAGLVESLRRDGLVRIEARNRVRLP
jgi:A/G-specific adenine glycosylase